MHTLTKRERYEVKKRSIAIIVIAVVTFFIGSGIFECVKYLGLRGPANKYRH
jgi:hypothetical protein